MKEYTNHLLKQFKGGDYKDFLAYVYGTFENQINTKKKKDYNLFKGKQNSSKEFLF